MHIAIVGGGIVGLTLANLLAELQQFKITVLAESLVNNEWVDDVYDLRCSALNLASRKVLESLGIWQQLPDKRVAYFDQMQIWETCLHGKVNFSALDHGYTELGYIVENRLLQWYLQQNLARFKNVEIIIAKVDDLQINGTSATVKSGLKTIEADLIVGADGGHSLVRRLAGIEQYGWSYDQSALVATIRSEYKHQNIARQRFSLDGPLAFLPLPDANLSSIVWSSGQDNIKRIMQLTADEFALELAEQFEHALGKLQLVGTRASFHLAMQHAVHYTGARVVLVGDAAHVIHPLAGQGVNLGIQDVTRLKNILKINGDCSEERSLLRLLRKYERASRGHNLAMITLMEAFKRGFSLPQPAVRKLIKYGMGLVDNMGWVNAVVMGIGLGEVL